MSEAIEEKPESNELVSVKRSTDIGKLVTALCKAQLAFDPIYKESENPAFKRGNRVSKYADLFSLVSATRKHLNNNGITIMQFPTVTLTGKNLIVTTLMAHESGEWISHELLIPAVDERGFTAHSIGKAMTYARRYSWQSVTGSVAEDDDDGNDVSGQGTAEAAQAVARQKIEQAAKAGNKTAQAALESQEQANGERSLFYVWHQESQTATILGDEALKKLNKDVLRDFWNPTAKAIVVNAQQLEDLKYTLERRQCPFSALPSN